MSFSKPIQHRAKKGGAKNTKSHSDKKDEVMSEQNIKSTLDMECKCAESCMWKLMNETENIVESIEALRKPRFTGP